MGFRFGDILRYRWTVDLEIRWPLEVSLLASFLVDWPLFRTDMLDITIFATRLAELLLPRPVSFSSLCPPLTRESQRQMVRWLTSSASVTWLWVMPPTARGPIDSVPWHPGHPVPGNDLCSPPDRSGPRQWRVMWLAGYQCGLRVNPGGILLMVIVPTGKIKIAGECDIYNGTPCSVLQGKILTKDSLCRHFHNLEAMSVTSQIPVTPRSSWDAGHALNLGQAWLGWIRLGSVRLG